MPPVWSSYEPVLGSSTRCQGDERLTYLGSRGHQINPWCTINVAVGGAHWLHPCPVDCALIGSEHLEFLWEEGLAVGAPSRIAVGCEGGKTSACKNWAGLGFPRTRVDSPGPGGRPHEASRVRDSL